MTRSFDCGRGPIISVQRRESTHFRWAVQLDFSAQRETITTDEKSPTPHDFIDLTRIYDHGTRHICRWMFLGCRSDVSAIAGRAANPSRLHRWRYGWPDI